MLALQDAHTVLEVSDFFMAFLQNDPLIDVYIVLLTAGSENKR